MEYRTYRPFPGYPLSALIAALMTLWGLGVIVRDPDVVTPKGLLILLLFGVFEVFALCAGIRFVRASWRFTITPDHLIAERTLSGDRAEITWPSIGEVVTVPRAWWNRRGGFPFNEIVTADGRRIMFGMYLSRYREFLDELKQRAVQCRRFEPYEGMWQR